MIHINLTPNTEEGWADKVLKTNLWPINLDTWAALKASENEIFFVEDDVEPNTEGQFNDIPTKLELRTNDLCTHLINKSLLKEFILIFFRRGIRVLNSRGGRRHIYPHIHTWFAQVLAIIMLGWFTYLLFIFEGPKGRYGPHEVWAHMGWVGHPPH